MALGTYNSKLFLKLCFVFLPTSTLMSICILHANKTKNKNLEFYKVIFPSLDMTRRMLESQTQHPINVPTAPCNTNVSKCVVETEQ